MIISFVNSIDVMTSVQSIPFIRVAQDRARKKRWRKHKGNIPSCRIWPELSSQVRTCRLVDEVSTLLCRVRWYVANSTLRRASNRFLKKNSHADSSQIGQVLRNPPNPDLQVFSSMLDAVEGEWMFCVVVRVGRAIHFAEDGDSVMQHSSLTHNRWRLPYSASTSTCGQQGPTHSTASSWHKRSNVSTNSSASSYPGNWFCRPFR